MSLQTWSEDQVKTDQWACLVVALNTLPYSSYSLRKKTEKVLKFNETEVERLAELQKICLV